MDIQKCEFDIKETVFLEVIVSGNDFHMNSKKMTTVMNWLTPMNLKETQAFIGFVNFYQQFIRGFSTITKSLMTLIRKEQPFLWNEVCKSVFELLKQQMASASMLQHFNPDK